MTRFLFYSIFILLFSGCGKEFLDIKRDSNQVVPHTIDDYLAILDNRHTLAWSNFSLGTLGEDSFELDPTFLKSLSGENVFQRNAYIWAEEIYEGSEVRDWNNAYERIMIANLALDVEKLDAQEDPHLWNLVRGTAYFHRAWNYYQLAQQFCKHFDAETAELDPGIPLRLDYDITVAIERGTVKQVYDRMIADLNIAKELLPRQIPNKFRPSKAAAHALLARIFLFMGEYDNALLESESCLKLQNELIDFNTLDFDKEFTFEEFRYGMNNPEVLFCAQLSSMSAFSWSRINMSRDLLSLYEEGDLRKGAYFEQEADGRVWFKGSLTGLSQYYTGLATGEVYQIKAECLIRLGKIDDGLMVLRHLLSKRFIKEANLILPASREEDALRFLFEERQKELVLRGVRWSDLRRLDLDVRFARILTRRFDNTEYTLEPRSPKWTWPLPYNEADLTPQNPR